MIFNSLAFAVFLPIVFLLYWAAPNKYRWILLLGASCYFYMSGSPDYIFLLLAVTIITYVCALMMEKTVQVGRKRLWMWCGILLPLASLAYFKYFDFSVTTVVYLARAVSIPLDDFTRNIVLPIGISFYTFKAVSYILDVYRGKQQAEYHFGYYALFISYFPDVISGPIDRAGLLLPQFKKDKVFCYADGVYALRLMLLGFMKKLLLADALTKYTDMIFNEVTHYSGFTLVFASFLFTIQIYCDFSGYSDIAIGVSKLLGIDLMQNFNSPYFAKSIKEFWGRWHISLSTWFRDYVYIPLGGNRVGQFRKAVNVMVTFLVSGLWHGASYTYIVWGGIHGLYQVMENVIHDMRKKRKAHRQTEDMPALENGGGAKAASIVRSIIQTAVTFVLVDFAWIFFRSNGLRGALYFVTHMFSDFSFTRAMADMMMSPLNLVKIGSFIVLLAVYDYFSGKRNLLKEMDRLPAFIRWGLYFGIVLVMAVLKIHNGTTQQFIYFQF